MIDMASKQIIPAVISYTKELAELDANKVSYKKEVLDEIGSDKELIVKASSGMKISIRYVDELINDTPEKIVIKDNDRLIAIYEKNNELNLDINKELFINIITTNAVIINPYLITVLPV